jgi:hypothetical protein
MTNRWVVTGVGAAIGLALGIGVSLATSLPFAPEIGLVAGGGVGFLVGSRISGKS